MPIDQKTLEYRVRESWRVRACTAGLCVGAQTFLFGTGVAMPVTLNSAWIAALAVLPAAAWITAACRRTLNRVFSQDEPQKVRRGFRALHLLLALTLLFNCVFALSALVSFAEQTLIGQTRAAWSAALAVIAVFLCAFGGGTGVCRLCFALRWGMPLLLFLLIAAAVPKEIPVSLFPLLGAGPLPLGAAGLCMLGAASPALMLFLPPAELEVQKELARRCPVPDTRFFLWRVLAGAGVGVLLLFVASVCVTYESIAENGEWGARLRVIAGYQAHAGVRQMLLTALQAIVMALSAAVMLSSAEQALMRACPRAGRMHAGGIALSLLLAICLAALIVFGFDSALFAAPGLVLPVLILLIFNNRLGALPR